METNSFALSVLDRLRSKRNRLFFALRKQIAFTRKGYKETGNAHTFAAWEKSLPGNSREIVADLRKKYSFDDYREKLSLESWQKNLATLWILEQFPELITAQHQRALEAGAHDFQRAPALFAFFHAQGKGITLTGVELDAYRVLHDLHSRFDRALYFASLVPGATYECHDFFDYSPSPLPGLVFVFYPFVSPHPALAWGLPYEFGSANAWIQACARVTAAGAKVFLLHQGKWEEEEFQEALSQEPPLLRLEKKQVLECPFYPTPYPMYASLYTRTLAC